MTPADLGRHSKPFQEQRWAVRAGASRSVALDASNLPEISEAKVVLSSSACAWPASPPLMSGFSPTKPVTVDWSGTVPPTGTTVYGLVPVGGYRTSSGPDIIQPGENGVPDVVVSVAFSGRVAVSSDCVGEYQLREEVSGDLAAAVACDDAIVEGNTAIVPFFVNGTTNLKSAAYYIVVTGDTVEDYSGERVPGSSSLGIWTISAGGVDTSAPELVGAVPRNQELLLVGEQFELHFSESVVAPGTVCFPDCIGTGGKVRGSLCDNPNCIACSSALRIQKCGAGVPDINPAVVEVYDCGEDLACGETSADVLIATFQVADQIGSNASWLVLDGSTVLLPFDDWLLVPARRYKVVVPEGAFVDLAGNWVTPGETEFVYSSYPFDGRRAVAAASTVAMDKVEYDLHVAADTAPGTYRICYCNSAADLSPKRAQADTSTYYLLPPGKGTPVRFTGATVAGRPLEEHLCDPKCMQGCAGDDCFCADLDFTMSRDLYCLSPQLCADACHAAAGCMGVSVKGERCALLDDLSSVTAAFGWATYSKALGAPCTDPNDFGIDAGAVVVTQAVDVGVDFVVTPGEPAVLEVSGVGLMSQPPLSATAHRISIIDSFGRCGVSAPVEAAGGPLVLAAETEEPLWSPALWMRDSTSRGYSRVEGTICPKTNIPVDGPDVPLEGWMRPLSAHQCYGKCLAESCSGDNCFCKGALSGYDGPTSNALCADADLCEKLCESLEECSAYEMHRSLPRCFLNDNSCFAYPPEASADYDLFLKHRPIDVEHGEFRSPPRQLLSPMDSKTSHEKLLRFPVTVPTGGSFKVCFCESEGAPCSDPQHFAVELGALHSSGISCLLHDNTKSKTCVPMPGGLRCYAGEVPDVSPPHFDVEVK
jgi:hypothetical protein